MRIYKNHYRNPFRFTLYYTRPHMTTSSLKWCGIATPMLHFLPQEECCYPQKTSYLERLCYKSSGERMGTSRRSPAALIIMNIMFLLRSLGHYCQKRTGNLKTLMFQNFPLRARIFGRECAHHDFRRGCAHLGFRRGCARLSFRADFISHRRANFSAYLGDFPAEQSLRNIFIFQKSWVLLHFPSGEECCYPPENLIFGKIGSGIVWWKKRDTSKVVGSAYNQQNQVFALDF